MLFIITNGIIYISEAGVVLTGYFFSSKTPDLRFSLALCQAEKTFLRSRRRKVLEGMQRILGAKAPSTEKQVRLCFLMTVILISD